MKPHFIGFLKMIYFKKIEHLQFFNNNNNKKKKNQWNPYLVLSFKKRNFVYRIETFIHPLYDSMDLKKLS